MEQNQVVNPEGTYSYVYRTSNGINAEENGIGGVSATGSYDFVSSDGVPISIQYEADENGYRAYGPSSMNLSFALRRLKTTKLRLLSVPQPPAIPEYIQRALEYIRNNPPTDDFRYK